MERHFLDEEKADGSLERIMKNLDDDILKAKTSEEKGKAIEQALKSHEIFNERLRIQNTRLVDEAKNQFDFELRQQVVEDDKAKARKDRIVKVALKGVEFGLMGLGILMQGVIIHNNIIETDSVSKGVTRGIIGKFGDYLKGC